MRPVALGRKNWLFAGSVAAAGAPRRSTAWSARRNSTASTLKPTYATSWAASRITPSAASASCCPGTSAPTRAAPQQRDKRQRSSAAVQAGRLRCSHGLRRPTLALGAAGRAAVSHGAARWPVPAPARTLWRGRVRRRGRRPRWPSLHESSQVLHDGRVVPEHLVFGCPSRLLVGPDVDAIQERQAELQASLLDRASRRSHTPRWAQRMKVWAAIHQGPCSCGSARHLAPLSWRQRMAPMVRRRLPGGALAWGKHTSIGGSSSVHCASVSIPPHPQNRKSAGQGAWFRR